MDVDALILDTNFILDYLKGMPACHGFLKSRGETKRWISDITRIELLSFPRLDQAAKKEIEDFLGFVEILPITVAVGDIAIAFRKATRKKLPDSLIAATAIHLKAPLVTSDRELIAATFPGFSTLQP